MTHNGRGYTAVRNFVPRRFSLRGLAEPTAPQALEPLAVDRETAAKLLGVTPGTFRGLVERGEIRGKMLGRKMRFLVEDLKSFLAQNENTRPKPGGGRGTRHSHLIRQADADK